ncbi:MAG: tRNA-binding protein [Synergistaceae bacterium]|nr:tRNA-binding protein [Synergistaceae bacterium]
MAVYEDFAKLDIRAGTIIHAEEFPKARKPAYKLIIDFGDEIGIKKSSAQLTKLYTPEDLTGKKILAVVNFPARQIADFMSEVLVLGTDSPNGIVLAVPDKPEETNNGDKLC